MKVERARQQDYAELMDLMVRCFRTNNPAHPRFEDLLPDLYQPTAEHMERHLVLREGGLIVSSTGLYPIEVKMGDVRLRVAGIGGVSTAPECRGKGYMSRILERAREEIRAGGYALSWLSGDRDRYARFGWEKAGSDLYAQIKGGKKEDPGAGWESRRLDPARDSLADIVAARSELSMQGLCDEATLRLKYGRINVELWEARRAGSHAFLAVNVQNRWFVDWGGDAGGLYHLVCRCATDAATWWQVCLPRARDRHTDFFLSLTGQHGGWTDNLAVFDLPALLRAYEPWLARAWPEGRSLALSAAPADAALTARIADGRVSGAGGGADVSLSLSPLRLSSFLFGPAEPTLLLDLPREAAWLDQVFPLPLYVPMLWHV